MRKQFPDLFLEKKKEKRKEQSFQSSAKALEKVSTNKLEIHGKYFFKRNNVLRGRLEYWETNRDVDGTSQGPGFDLSLKFCFVTKFLEIFW